MKERPILYSPQMIRARREGRKTQTRRIVMPQSAILTDEMARSLNVRPPEQKNQPVIACPKGNPGDHLWVQENHRLRLHNGDAPPRCVEVEYCADGEIKGIQLTVAEWVKMLSRKNKATDQFGAIIPGRFMYRSLSRGLDEIIAVRVERLQDITEEDAIAEGCQPACCQPQPCRCAAHPTTYRAGYAKLWDSINAKDPAAAIRGEAHPWDSNPFVWVITFKVIQ